MIFLIPDSRVSIRFGSTIWHPVLRNVATNANIVYIHGKHKYRTMHIKDRIGFSILLSYIITKSADLMLLTQLILAWSNKLRFNFYIVAYLSISVDILCIGNTLRFTIDALCINFLKTSKWIIREQFWN